MAFPQLSLDQTCIVGVTLLIGVTGAALASFIGMPAPYLTGPAAFVSLAGLLGVKTNIPSLLRDCVFLTIGLSLGAGVTPEILQAAKTWPISLVIMCLGVTMIMLLGGLMFHKFFGMNRKTALLAATPGHLSFVIGFSTEIGADTATIALVQSLRVLILTLMVPMAVSLFTDADLSMQANIVKHLSTMHFTILVVLAVVIGLILKRLKFPAAFLIAGMICSTIGHGSGATPGFVWQPLTWAAFITMGSLIGIRFSGVTFAMLRKASLAGIAFTVLSLAIAALAAWLVALATGLPLIDLLVAFAPGGLETMVAMAAVLNADPAFVAFHHVARLLFLSVLVPLGLSLKFVKQN